VGGQWKRFSGEGLEGASSLQVREHLLGRKSFLLDVFLKVPLWQVSFGIKDAKKRTPV
jgi:hypothetical protein